MTTTEQMAIDVLDLERAIAKADEQRAELRQALAARKKELANARKKAKLSKPVRDETARLAEAQHKLRELRVAAANALRARGATIAEVEAVFGVSYMVVRAADERLQREARSAT
jgi:1,6-anhydro-N-acetylmuramate kinase